MTTFVIPRCAGNQSRSPDRASKKPCDRSNRILDALINMNFQATSNYRWLGILFFRWLGYHVADNSPESGSIRSSDIAIYIPTINPKESVLQQQNLLRILWFGRAVDYLWPIGFEGKRGSTLVFLGVAALPFSLFALQRVQQIFAYCCFRRNICIAINWDEAYDISHNKSFARVQKWNATKIERGNGTRFIRKYLQTQICSYGI